jgi:hypothetical protein
VLRVGVSEAPPGDTVRSSPGGAGITGDEGGGANDVR